MRSVLGQVTMSSGRLAVVDAGLLRSWQSGHVERAVSASSGAAMFDYGGPNAAIVPGIPSGTLQILGTRTNDGRNWRFIDLVCDADGIVARAEVVGGLIVDEARVMLSDLAALGAWQHDASIDGKADVAFWGRDADAIAAKMGAGQLPEGVWGWADLDVSEAERRFRELTDAREAGATFMPDYRPHSHHFAAMARVRASPLEVGHVVANGQTCFVAKTSWGDGVYPVLVLRDAGGKLLGVRIDLARDAVQSIGEKLGVQAWLPPDPMTSTKTAMAGAATNMAQNAARRAVVGKVKEYLPRPLWPLIPGERGDAMTNVANLGKKKAWAVAGSCLFSVVFFALLAAAFGVVALIVVYAVVTG